MIKLLSCKQIVECEHIDADTGEVLLTYVDLYEVQSIYEAKSQEIEKHGNVFCVEVSAGVWTIVGNMREFVSFWNEYRTKKNLIFN